MEYIWCLLVTTICPCLSLLHGTNNPSTGELLSLITQLNQTIQVQNTVLNKRISALETIETEHNRTIETQRKTVAAQNSTIDIQSKKIAALENTVTEQAKKIAVFETSQVAFYAELDADVKLGQRQTIEFGHVVVNIGNAYDLRHGHFTAPVDGLYIFTVTIMKYPSGSELHVELIKNGVEIGRIYSDATPYNQASTTSFVQLNAGDMVWARHTSGVDTEHMYGGHYSSFGGALISKL